MLPRPSLVFSLLLLCSQALSAMELTTFSRDAVHAPTSLGDIELVADSHNFFVKKNGMLNRVQRYDVDQTLREAHKKQAIQQLLKNGYVSVSQYNNGDYKLNVHGRVNGGGPIVGYLLYGAVKLVSYSALTGVAAGAVTAGAAVVAPGAVAAGIGTVVATAAEIGAGTVATATAIVATEGAALATAAGATAATVATVTAAPAVAAAGVAAVAAAAPVVGEVAVAAAASAGGIAGLFAAIETAASAAFVFGMSLPTP